MFGRGSSQSHHPHWHGIARLLAHEITTAEKNQSPMGMFLLRVPAVVPRGVGRLLPGRTLGYQLYRNSRRYVGVVHDSCDRDLMTMRTTIEEVAQRQGWFPFTVGVALWPENGRVAEELLQWARFDAQRRAAAPLQHAGAPDAVGEAAGEPSPGAVAAGTPRAAAGNGAPARAVPLLGRFLVQRGYVTEEELRRALEFQRFQHTSLGSLALQRGLLTESEVLDILFHQEEQGELFGEAAVALGLLTEEQISALLNEQRMNLPPLGQVLQRLGLVSPTDLARALDELGCMIEKARPQRGHLLEAPPLAVAGTEG
ncbi:MAG: hypothetical protein HYY96_07020 [Candidatus Tectomicrobia bacterium]|nr:hypothetical protein [Candidatus Tectomicrobia bacterium]